MRKVIIFGAIMALMGLALIVMPEIIAPKLEKIFDQVQMPQN